MKVRKIGFICPFCYESVDEDFDACCGEIHHGEEGYEDSEGDRYLKSELKEGMEVVDE